MLDYLTRRPRALVAMVATSAVYLGVSTVGYFAGVDAETRATLHTEIDHASASITRTVETGRAIVASHFTAATCVIEASDRLAPVAPAVRRMRLRCPALLRRSCSVLRMPRRCRRTPRHRRRRSRPPRRVSLTSASPSRCFGRLRPTPRVRSTALASTARHAEPECVSARAAVRALVDEIASRTDGLIAERPKAAADTVSALRSARDAVVSGNGNGVETWLAAAAALGVVAHCGRRCRAEGRRGGPAAPPKPPKRPRQWTFRRIPSPSRRRGRA